MGVKEALGDNKKFLFLALTLLVVSVMIMFSLNSNILAPLSPIPNNRISYTEPRDVLEEDVDYMITIKTVYGDINIDLYEDLAPENVNSLLFLMGERYYEGLTFHSVIKDFKIQTGDAKGDGTGDPGYTVKLENTATVFTDYTVGMANASQFFIVLPNSEKEIFNGQYSLVGEVTSGFAVVDSIAKVEVGDDYEPINDVVINYIQITE